MIPFYIMKALTGSHGDSSELVDDEGAARGCGTHLEGGAADVFHLFLRIACEIRVAVAIVED